jgi:TolB-like protein
MSPRQSFPRLRVFRIAAGLAIAAATVVVSPLWADTAPSTPRPVAAKAQTDTKVAVVDLGSAANDVEGAKMAAALKTSLVNELALGGLEVATPGHGENRTDRLKIARDSGAAYAVTGDVQAVGGAVRFTGQVSDLQSGKVIAPLQATGPATEFFGVQDEFVRQAKAALMSAGGRPVGAMPANPNVPADVGPVPSSIPMSEGSHWAGYNTAPSTAQTVVLSQPPTPPPPPLYGGYRSPNYGGGSYVDSGYSYPLPDGVVPTFPLGTVRTEYLGSRGVSIIPPPPTVGRNPRSVPGDYYRTQGPTPIPPYAQSIRKYVNPNTRFAAPVGQPQRAAQPNLRPGT